MPSCTSQLFAIGETREKIGYFERKSGVYELAQLVIAIQNRR
jgi:hypothetical protein